MEKERCRVKTNRHLLRRIAGGLTALAMILVMLPASALAAPGDISEETCTVDYKTQSPGVTYDGYTKGEDNTLILNYTIGETAPENIVIDLAQGSIDAWTSTIDYVMPGDHVKVKIKITNNSGRTYEYKNNSFVFSPCDTSEVASFEDGSMLPVLTYDGQYLPIRYAGSMLPEYFYSCLMLKMTLKLHLK